MSRAQRLAAMALVVALAAVAAFVITNRDADGDATLDASYPEGPLFQGATLYYAEMRADVVTVVENGAKRPFFRQSGCGPTAIAPYGDGYLVLCHIGKRLVAVSADGVEVRRWAADDAGAPLLDPNDASTDGRGGVYFSDPGVFSRRVVAQGRVMHLAADGRLRIVADSLWYPNGVYVDAARSRLLVSEHLEGRVVSFDIRPDGSLGVPTTFARVADAGDPKRYAMPYAETGPDGLEVGPDGDLYVALYGAGRILRFASDGTYRGDTEVPARFCTNIAFAPDGTAAITSVFDNARPPFPGEVRLRSVTG